MSNVAEAKPTTEAPKLSKVQDDSNLTGKHFKEDICVSKIIKIANAIMKDPQVAKSGIIVKDRNGDIWMKGINFAKTDPNTGEPIIDDYDQTHAKMLSLTTQQTELYGNLQIGDMLDSKGKPLTYSNAYIGSAQELGAVTFTDQDALSLDTSNEY